MRDPVTRVPKIPGSSLAGVTRAYVATGEQGKFPRCAGQGGKEAGHCGLPGCPGCTVFGFAKSDSGGFAGLASFSDMHVLFFPVPTWNGPHWITSPMALKTIYKNEIPMPNSDAAYPLSDGGGYQLNLGWLYLEVESGLNLLTSIVNKFITKTDEDKNAFSSITQNTLIVSDKLFSHIVNSNLEVRTSVAIDPATGAAEDGALFTYEALPRGTVLAWELTCRNPKHFKVDGKTEPLSDLLNSDNKKYPDEQSLMKIKDVVCKANSYLEHLGIGGMGSRGMGRLRVLSSGDAS